MAGQLNSFAYRPIESWPGELTRDRKPLLTEARDLLLSLWSTPA